MAVSVFPGSSSHRVLEKDKKTGGLHGCAGNAETRNRPQHIEVALDWAFRRERVEAALSSAEGLQRAEYEADGGVWFGSSSDGVATIMAIAALGCRVDSSGHVKAMSDGPPADALALHAAVLRLDRRRCALVARHARHGTTPPWLLPGPLSGRARRGGAGRSGRVLTLTDQAGGAPYCPLAWSNTAADLAAMRSDYRAWITGLEDVWHDLAGRSVGQGGVSFPLLAPAVAGQPWEAERDLAERPGPAGLLDADQVAAIRAAKAQGRSIRAIASFMGVSASTVARALPPAVHDLAARQAAARARARRRR